MTVFASFVDYDKDVYWYIPDALYLGVVEPETADELARISREE